MKKTWKMVIVSLPWIVSSIMSCKNDTPPQSTFTPGKRDYIWSSDTLFYLGNAQTAMQSMYASSPTNVYIGGCPISSK